MKQEISSEKNGEEKGKGSQRTVPVNNHEGLIGSQ